MFWLRSHPYLNRSSPRILPLASPTRGLLPFLKITPILDLSLFLSLWPFVVVVVVMLRWIPSSGNTVLSGCLCDSFLPDHVVLPTFQWHHFCVCHTSHLTHFHPGTGWAQACTASLLCSSTWNFISRLSPGYSGRWGTSSCPDLASLVSCWLEQEPTGSKSHLGSWAPLSQMAQRVPLPFSKVLTSLSGTLHRRKGSLGSEHTRQQDWPVTGAPRGLA